MSVFKKRMDGMPEIEPETVSEEDVRAIIKANFPDADPEELIAFMKQNPGTGSVAVRGVQYFVEKN